MKVLKHCIGFRYCLAKSWRTALWRALGAAAQGAPMPDAHKDTARLAED